MKFNKEHAKELISAFEIRQILDDEEEVECLKNNNPFQLEAYKALVEFAEE